MAKGAPTLDPYTAVQKRLAELLGQKYEWMATSAKLLKIARDPKRLDHAIATLQRDFGVTLNPGVLKSVRTVNDLVQLVGNAAEQLRSREAPPSPAPPLPPLPRLPDGAGGGGSATATSAPAGPRRASGDTFDSSLAYDGDRIHAVALHCCDGRFGDHVDDFMQNGLGLPRYDRLTCPGGPVALAGRLATFWELRGVEEQLRFMIKAHELERVVLIAHQPCAYYITRLGVPPESMESEQRQDLEQAMWEVQRMAPGLDIGSFVSWVDAGKVRFEKLQATTGLNDRMSRWKGRSRG
jgi:hypothetical protein